MQPKKKPGSAVNDPDDAPPLTEAMFRQAEIFQGDNFIGRGRPKLAQPKEQVAIRLDHEVITQLRQSGPGWQTRVNAILRTALGLDPA